MEDKIIIKYIKKKKEEGLRLLINNYGDYINTIVRNNLNNLTYYQDECINDILLSIWNNIDSFDNKKNTLKNWIGVISKYKTIDYKRKYLKDSKEEQINEEILSIDKNLLKNEIEEEVEELLSNLKEKDKNLFIKYYIEELDIETIAKNMNTKPFNLYSRLSRCKKKLRELYSDK
ncbi:MAG: sigma-70 family RNA polymerase sigma factor [Romboutsia sp.]|uniref:sigma-70 family RNA polymerase sigma factor n=1 Tax=Romboutsia sp. TaxID=1965302 RepID=UPI003F384289